MTRGSDEKSQDEASIDRDTTIKDARVYGDAPVHAPANASTTLAPTTLTPTTLAPLALAPLALPPKLRPIQRRWTPHELDILRNEVVRQEAQATRPNSTVDWSNVVRLLPWRTRRDCREKWKQTLDPRVRHGPWSLDEDRLLVMLVRAYAEVVPCETVPCVVPRVNAANADDAAPVPRWSVIARTMANGRTASQCRSRWRNVLRFDYGDQRDDGSREAVAQISTVASISTTTPPTMSMPPTMSTPHRNTGRWTPAETQRLNEGMSAHPRHWSRIATDHVRTRNAQQCEARWWNMHWRRTGPMASRAAAEMREARMVREASMANAEDGVVGNARSR